MSDHLIVALGNPGREYEETRHNIAWQLIDRSDIADKIIWKEKFKGLYGSLDLAGERFYFLRPMTYMNLSGESVRPMMDFFKIDKSKLLVIHDELDFSFGVLGFKPGGGLAGHNGLKSIAQHLGDGEFKRLRMGIGRPPFGSVSDWVLSRFSDDEQIALPDYYKMASKALECYMKEGFSKAASQYSKKNALNKE